MGGAGGSVFVGAGEPDSRALADERVDALRQPCARARADVEPRLRLGAHGAPRCKRAGGFAGANGGDSVLVFHSQHHRAADAAAGGLGGSGKNPQAGQVRLTVMPPSDMVAALATKQIGGFIVAEPFNALAEAKGVGKILRFSGDIWRDHACCLSMMHDHDIQSRPEWVQNVINALVDAAAFAKHRRAETAELLAKQGIRHYTPHDAKVLRAVLQPEPIVWQKYERTGAIRHADWQQRRVDFQPFPFQSYSELLVKLLKETHLAGVNTFLNDVQPEKAARELFDTRFVERALQRDGLMSSFGLQSLQRQEAFAL